MSIVAYYGDPDDRVFGRTTFASWEQARVAVWHDSALFDLHDTDEKRTRWDRRWDETGEPEPKGQLALFTA